MSKSNVLYIGAQAATSSPPKTRVTVANARPRRRWSALVLGFFAAAFLIALGALLGWGTAHGQPAVDAAPVLADAAPTPAEAGSGAGTAEPVAPAIDAPDPVTDPIGFGAKVLQLYRSGALLPAVILLLFGVAVFLRAKFGWFAKGKQAVYLAAGIAGLTMLAEAASRGTTPNAGMFVAAIAMMVGLVLNPAKGDGKG